MTSENLNVHYSYRIIPCVQSSRARVLAGARSIYCAIPGRPSRTGHSALALCPLNFEKSAGTCPAIYKHGGPRSSNKVGSFTAITHPIARYPFVLDTENLKESLRKSRKMVRTLSLCGLRTSSGWRRIS